MQQRNHLSNPVLTTISVAALLAACGADEPEQPEQPEQPELARVASFGQDMPTGVAISSTGRLFVTFPRLFLDPAAPSLASVGADGSLTPYPDAERNGWQPGDPIGEAFVSVQSAYVDARDRLWVLDVGNPFQMGVIPGAAKLVEIDLASDQVARTITFDDQIVPAQAFLNDVRVDPDGEFAYVTDAALGRLLVVDLRDDSVREVLAGHPSMLGEPGLVVTAGGVELRLPDGSPVVGHVDGIAVTAEFVYYHALTARDLFRIPSALLKDPAATDEELAAAVERVAETGVHDGIEVDREGNVYLTDVEDDAISRLAPDGTLERLITDPRIQWPDSVAIASDGTIYVTMSQIHLLPPFNGGEDRRVDPPALFALSVP